MANKKMNPVAAGAVGAMVGAAVGAGAVMLSDPKNRKMIKNKFETLKKQGQKAYSDLQDKMEDLTSEGKGKLTAKVKEVKKNIKSKL